MCNRAHVHQSVYSTLRTHLFFALGKRIKVTRDTVVLFSIHTTPRHAEVFSKSLLLTFLSSDISAMHVCIQ